MSGQWKRKSVICYWTYNDPKDLDHKFPLFYRWPQILWSNMTFEDMNWWVRGDACVALHVILKIMQQYKRSKRAHDKKCDQTNDRMNMVTQTVVPLSALYWYLTSGSLTAWWVEDTTNTFLEGSGSVVFGSEGSPRWVNIPITFWWVCLSQN